MNLRKKYTLKILLLLLSLFLVACGGDAEMDHGNMDHGEMEIVDGDTSFTQMSDDGTFHLTLESENDMLMINELHTWILTIQGADMSTAIEDATIQFDGGMPEHNHGFPTEPEVTGHIGEGQYRIEGVKFQMGGNWEMDLVIEAGGESDTAKFKIAVPQ